jgi:broad specificity phosphatase PhoE
VGQAEAAGLLVRLDDYPVGRILSSPTVRCQQTVQPLAHDRYLPIEILPALGVAADPVAVLALLGDDQLRDAVVCTHGEVIAEVLGRLVVMDGLAVNQPLAWPKGSTWLLDGADGRLRSGRYLPPLPLADALTPLSATAAMRANSLQPASQQRRQIEQLR